MFLLQKEVMFVRYAGGLKGGDLGVGVVKNAKI